MGRAKNVLLSSAGMLLLVQFIQPINNTSLQAYPADISRIYPMDGKVRGILKTACYDCHSNNTNYTWYGHLQPSGWWLASHIKKGKQELNFNEFGDYPKRRRQSKLTAMGNSIKDGSMPLRSYTLIHRKARLSKAEQDLILDWIEKTKDSLSKNQ